MLNKSADIQELTNLNILHKPSREEAEKAVEVLIRYAGDDPTREGLLETPKRVVNSYSEFFSGYTKDADAILEKTFEEVEV